MLNAERGDCGSVSKIIEQYSSTLTQDGTDLKPDSFDINCTDPLGRTALSIAIINENPELIEILLENGIQTRDSLLLAIDEEYVEAVELLLEHEERTWKVRIQFEINFYVKLFCTRLQYVAELLLKSIIF